MNIIIVLKPLIGTVFSVMYYYNSKEYTELLLAQPIKDQQFFRAIYRCIYFFNIKFGYRYRHTFHSLWNI